MLLRWLIIFGLVLATVSGSAVAQTALDWALRGRSAFRKGDCRQAVGHFDKALAQPGLSPKQAGYVHFHLGLCHERLGRIRQAIQDYTRFIRLKPDTRNTATAYYNRAVLRERLRNYRLAIKDYTEAIRLRPSYPKAYNNRGNCLSNLGQRSQALHDYNQAIRLKPDFAIAYYNRGAVYQELGQHRRARADYAKAKALAEGQARSR